MEISEKLTTGIRVAAIGAVALCGMIPQINAETLSENPETYDGYDYGTPGKKMYIISSWINRGVDRSDETANPGEMAVSEGIVYVAGMTSAESHSLARFDAKSGERLSDLTLSYPGGISAPPSPISHVGTDQNGILYVSAEVKNSDSPTIDIDIVNPTSGDVTNRISHNLKEISPSNYISMTSRFIAHPEITGDLSTGDYQLAAIETFDYQDSKGNDGIGIRLWRVQCTEWKSDDDPHVSKLLLPIDKTDGRIDAYIPIDEDARVWTLDSKKSLVDNGIDPPMYYTGRNIGINLKSYLEPDGGTVDKAAVGATTFEWDGQRYIVYGSEISGAVRYSVAHWMDTDNGLDAGNIKHVWTVPALPGGLGSGASGRTVTLSKTVPDSDGMNLFLYSPGHGLAAYALSDQKGSGTTIVADIDAPGTWELALGILHLPSARPLTVYNSVGTVIAAYNASVTHDLNALPCGVYILSCGDLTIKYISR